ncbi:hypothetical protein BGW39_009063 [Mortierella sp. 14UC]|nr:hypothetical protein BGW39_009063 [Mortierella sp. 14UC]
MQQQQPADKPLDHEQDKVNNQVEEDCRDSGYTSGASVDGQSRRESASSSVSANMAESRYICTLDGNHLTYYMDKAQARVSSEKEEEEAKEEEVEGKEAECEKVEKEKVEEEEDDEDEDEDEDEEDTDGESILPWVTRKTLRSDFDVLSFAADYNSAIRARVAAKATAQAQAEPDLLRVNNLRRRYGGALMEVTSRAVKGSRPVFRPALDKGSTDDRYVSYIKYPNSLDDDEDDHEYVLRPNCHYHGRSHLHSHFLPQIPDTIRMPDRLPYILDQHGNQHPLPPTAPIPHPSTWTIQLGPNYTPVVNYEVFVTCDNCSHKFWLTSEEPDLLDLHQQEYCRTSGQKAFPSLLLLVDKWVGYGRAGKRHWKKVERRTRMQAYRLMSWSINRTMDVLMALLLWVQALRDGIDVEVDVDVGNACGLGEAVPGDIYGEDSSEKVVQAIGTWQARSRSQPQTSPLLSAPQEDGPEEDLLAAAIPDDQDLAMAVQAITKTHPDTTPTITRLLTYIQAKHVSGDSATRPTKQPQGIAQFFKPASSNTTASATTVATTAGAGASAVDAPIGPAIYSTNPISFLHPVRKKLALSLHKSHIALVTTPSANPASTEVAFKASYEALYRVVAVPFLERATKNTALILFFRHSAFVAGGGSGAKDAIWAVPLPDDGKDFSLQVYTPNLGLVGLSQDLRITTSKTQPPLAFVNPPAVTGPTKRPDHILLSILSYFLQHNDTIKNSDTHIMDRIIPNPTPAYPNFSAHLKSNQGTIYLLPTGILFAFRKPVLFLRAAAIEAVGIHSVLSRTFDFEIVMDTTTPSDATSSGNSNGKDESRRGATVEDLEGVPESKDGRRAIGFGMVDTKEFGRMEEWIKKAGIRDRSMSEDLKAKDKAPTTNAAGGAGKKRERAVDGEEEEGAEGTAQKAAKGDNDGADEDDDDEDDDDFAPESEDELMEEYDSNAEGSDSDGGEDVEEEASRKKGKAFGGVRKADVEKKTKIQKEEDVDLDEESLGEDSEDDEDEDKDD